MEAIFLQGSGMIKLTIEHIILGWRWGMILVLQVVR